MGGNLSEVDPAASSRHIDLPVPHNLLTITCRVVQSARLLIWYFLHLPVVGYAFCNISLLSENKFFEIQRHERYSPCKLKAWSEIELELQLQIEIIFHRSFTHCLETRQRLILFLCTFYSDCLISPTLFLRIPITSQAIRWWYLHSNSIIAP